MHADSHAIEFHEPTTSSCDCCGALTTRLSRDLYCGQINNGYYLAMFSTGQRHFFVDATAVFGNFDDGSNVGDRVAFFLRIWAVKYMPTVMLVDPIESPYGRDEVGIPLSRAEALAHPFKQKLFDLTDHIVDCDEPIRQFLIERSLDDPP